MVDVVLDSLGRRCGPGEKRPRGAAGRRVKTGRAIAALALILIGCGSGNPSTSAGDDGAKGPNARDGASSDGSAGGGGSDAGATGDDAGSDAPGEAGGDGLAGDGSPDATVVDDGACRGPLSDVGGGCATTYDGALAVADQFLCNPNLLEYAGTCGGQPAVAFFFVTGFIVCVYESTGGGSLVGAALDQSGGTYCDRTPLIRAGTIPDACASTTVFAAPTLQLLGGAASCGGDGGADDASADALGDALGDAPADAGPDAPADAAVNAATDAAMDAAADAVADAPGEDAIAD